MAIEPLERNPNYWMGLNGKPHTRMPFDPNLAAEQLPDGWIPRGVHVTGEEVNGERTALTPATNGHKREVSWEVVGVAAPCIRTATVEESLARRETQRTERKIMVVYDASEPTRGAIKKWWDRINAQRDTKNRARAERAAQREEKKRIARERHEAFLDKIFAEREAQIDEIIANWLK